MSWLKTKICGESGPPIPKANTVIWRYMSLHAFLTLLTERRLMFRQFKELEESDRHEGRSIEGFWETVPDDMIDLKERSKKTREKLRYCCYASCWSMSEIESALMWSGYARQGVAIKTTVKQLREAQRDTTEQMSIQAAEIVYADNWTELQAQGYHHNGIPLNRLFMHTKRKAFTDEREARFSVQLNGSTHPALIKYPDRLPPDYAQICRPWFPITFTKLDWINKVVAESSIPEWAVATLRQMVEAQGLEFQQSGI